MTVTCVLDMDSYNTLCPGVECGEAASVLVEAHLLLGEDAFCPPPLLAAYTRLLDTAGTAAVADIRTRVAAQYA